VKASLIEEFQTIAQSFTNGSRMTWILRKQDEAFSINLEERKRTKLHFFNDLAQTRNMIATIFTPKSNYSRIRVSTNNFSKIVCATQGILEPSTRTFSFPVSVPPMGYFL
jgi:hypothetical protein